MTPVALLPGTVAVAPFVPSSSANFAVAPLSTTTTLTSENVIVTKMTTAISTSNTESKKAVIGKVKGEGIFFWFSLRMVVGLIFFFVVLLLLTLFRVFGK